MKKTGHFFPDFNPDKHIAELPKGVDIALKIDEPIWIGFDFATGESSMIIIKSDGIQR